MTETKHTRKPEQASNSTTPTQHCATLSALDSQLIGLLPLAAFICAAPSGELVHYNDQAAALWPDPQNHCDQFVEALHSLNASGSAKVQKPLAEALQLGTTLRDHAAQLVHPEGRAIPVLTTIDPIRSPDGEIIGVLALIREQEAEKSLRPPPSHEQLLAELPTPAYTCDAQGVITSYNEAAATLWGRRPSINDPSERFCGSVKLLTPAGAPLAPELGSMARALETNSDCLGHEVLIERPDGSRHAALAFASPLRDAADNATGAVTILIDMSANKNLPSQTRKLISELDSEYSRLLEVFDRSPVFMAVLRGPDHVFERANERYRRLIGNRPFIGQPVREALPEITSQGYVDILDRVYQSREPFIGTNLPVALSPAPGQPLQELTLEFVYEPLPAENGTEAGVLAVGVDLTERKRTEAKLAFLTAESARASRLYETILSATPDLVYVFDLNHRFVYANRALLEMWGLSWQESIGKTCLEIGYPDWHAAMHDREIEQVAATKLPVRGQVPFNGTQGERIYEYIFVPVLGEHGQVEAIAGTTRDITEHTQMEDELQHRAQQLANADQKKDEFIAMLAHELRNPLAPLRNGLQLLERGNLLEDTEKEIHAMMGRQLQHMVRLIDDLLDVSRLSRNKLSLQKAPVTVARVVTEAVETLRPTIEAAGHQLAVSLPDEPIKVHADLTRLAQVVGNLLSNSSKYTGTEGKIFLSAELQGQEIEITVKDNGIGIPPDALPNLFTMFTQVHQGHEQSTGGLGIGLALVKTLVEMHGGSVSAASDGLHQGSCFSVRLPILRESREMATQNQTAQQVPKSPDGKRVLVVDDNRDACNSMAMLFQMLGNEVQQAYDGLEAVSAAQTFRPDLILMDVGMPQLNGYDATRRIRNQAHGEKVTIIAVTGWGQEKDRSDSKAAGFDGHLVKPVGLADLEQLLNLQEPVKGG